MVAGQKNFHKVFARVSPVFVSLALAVVAVPRSTAASRSSSDADIPNNTKRGAASAQFERAEQQRAALNNKPPEKRMLADYKAVVATYRHVALITPRAPEVPDSLVALGELYTEMGDRFGRNYYQFAVDSYQFLVREYPSSRYVQDALLRIAKLQRDPLNDAGQATKSYAEFLKRYPRSPRKREAQEALAELALLQNSEAPASTGSATRPESSRATESKSAKVEPEEQQPKKASSVRNERIQEEETPVDSGVSGGRLGADGFVPRLRRIRTSATGDATRVTIDLEDSVQYTSARIANPDRIFFDLHAARLTPEMARSSIQVEGKLLTGIRVAQNHSGVVRVVLDVNGVKDYTASLTHNPTQLLIDLYGGPAPATRTANARKTAPAASDGAGEDSSSGARITEKGRSDASAATTAAKGTAAGRESGGAPKSAIVASTGTPGGASKANAASGAASGEAPESAPSTAIRNTLPTSKPVNSKSAKDGKPEFAGPVPAAQPKRDGGSTLTRTLGLKIGRIVIDPGHGGHDTGTIGPTGLMEKDLCLDVALRLGKIIQQRLPGAEVVFTRSDDTFIPLEERTALANEAKADLFISIHANSSPDHGARGVETYYLNLKGSAEAMEVAARENASSQQGVHDLEEMVKQIARTEKIDESKEFAQDVQGSLSQRIQRTVKTVRNRGVRKAPFVVLIGADMPSILTEISFLSNPADEFLLKKPDHRQRVAEGIYQGVASYLQSMNSVTVNLPAKRSTGGSTGRTASSTAQAVEPSRSQN
jgi:N-acetylmuramoyl-L-alanine amidase